jgi:Holliday junction resolvase RusA-like endonuclease
VILVETFVAGEPKTKGSLAVRGNGTLTDTPASKAWRAMMAAGVRDDIARRGACVVEGQMYIRPKLPWEGPVSVTAIFSVSPPPPRQRAWLGILQHWAAPIWPTAGDLDKLLRNLLDAIAADSKNSKYNGGAILNDNQVCRIAAQKIVVEPGQRAGVAVRIETLDNSSMHRLQ